MQVKKTAVMLGVCGALGALGYWATAALLAPQQTPSNAATGSPDGKATARAVADLASSAAVGTSVAQAGNHNSPYVQNGLFAEGSGGMVLAKSDGGYGVGDAVKKPKAKPNFDPAFTETEWDNLIPKGWDPTAAFKGLNLATLQDSDPRAMEALDKMRKAWDEAPVESSLNGKKIRIPGFAVPLEQSNKNVSELLLVPYFGACIHTPPPPANQIIYVKLKNKTPALGVMQPYWVWGEMKAARTSSSMGEAGYRLENASLLPYED